MPEIVPGLSSRSPGQQHHRITTQDLIISHTNSPAMKSVDSVRETEALPDAGIFNSAAGPGIGSSIDRRESHDCGHPPSVSRLAPTPHHHSPVRPPISSPDLPIHPSIREPIPECLIQGRVLSWIEEIAADEDGTDHIPGDAAARVFADTVYEVRLHTLSLPRHVASLLLTLRTRQSGFKSSRSPATAPEEIVARFMSCVRPPGFTS